MHPPDQIESATIQMTQQSQHAEADFAQHLPMHRRLIGQLLHAAICAVELGRGESVSPSSETIPATIASTAATISQRPPACGSSPNFIQTTAHLHRR